MEKVLLEGKVAEILNERELVINIGVQHGVRTGMKFAVLASTPLEISDPDTDEPLGAVDRIKVKVRAKHVQEKLSVCETYETRMVGGLFPLLSTFEAPRRIPVTLSTSEESVPKPLPPEESYVKKGDRVQEFEDSLAS
jgi:hypothetical protein